MSKLTTLALALSLPAVAGAGTFTPPQGCTAWLTVQSRGCNVSNYYTCEADPKGDQWRADFDQEGLFFQSRIDHETQWIESFEQNPVVRQTLDPNPRDPASFSALLATGRDEFDFSLTKDNGEHSTVRGFDQLTGETETIDGITFEVTAYDYVETDAEGNILRQSHGHEYISREWRNFFSGEGEWWTEDGWVPYVARPMQFIFPGEPGFAATQPLFECDALMSQAEIPGLTQARFPLVTSPAPAGAAAASPKE